MNFTNIYRNGKPQYFFIMVDDPNEISFIHPYFLATTSDHQRHGRILEMACLFSASVWQGRQTHGYGYSCSADVYGELIRIIEKVHKNRLTDTDREELRKINTHDERLTLSQALLANLSKYNAEAIEESIKARWGD